MFRPVRIYDKDVVAAIKKKYQCERVGIFWYITNASDKELHCLQILNSHGQLHFLEKEHVGRSIFSGIKHAS